MTTTQVSSKVEFENLSDRQPVKVLATATTPGGIQYRTIQHGSALTILGTVQGNPVTITGATPDLSLGGIIDEIGDALTSLAKLISCKPVQTTHIDVKDGQITGVTITNSCAP